MKNSNHLDDKKALRQHYRTKRLSLTQSLQDSASDAICNKIIQQVPTLQAADNIAFYLSRDGEINLMPLILYCLDKGKKCYLPVLNKSGKNTLSFAAWTTLQNMKNNKYGIPEPDVDQDELLSICEIDLVFMPLVAFDQRGNRLGMGGGYYDRTLAACQDLKTGKKPIVVAAGHDIQYSSELPIDEWDILPDICLSPGKLIQSSEYSTKRLNQ